jgi:hypothetical protein
MNEVKCVNAKNYKLTIGKTYNINSIVDDEYYELLNDNNKLVKYKKDLFIVTQSTIAEVLASIEDNEDGQFKLSIDGNTIEIDCYLEFDDTQISCGIKQVSEINDLVNSIVDKLTPYDRETLIDDVILSIFKNIINNCLDNAAMLLISTNLTNNNVYEKIDKLLTPFTKASHIALNPNSHNTIKLWVIDVAELIN